MRRIEIHLSKGRGINEIGRFNFVCTIEEKVEYRTSCVLYSAIIQEVILCDLKIRIDLSTFDYHARLDKMLSFDSTPTSLLSSTTASG